MDIKIFSLFSEMFSGPLGSSLLGKARSKDILNIEVINFREYSTNKHHAVDDYPFGGGAGMVLQPDPVVSALRSNLNLHAPDTDQKYRDNNCVRRCQGTAFLMDQIPETIERMPNHMEGKFEGSFIFL